jgi:hypothetical protein
MSNVGDALSGGGSSASGVTDSTFSDASLGDQMMGGTGDFTGGDITASDAGGGGFQNYSNLTNALSAAAGGGTGASPVAAQTASMTPPGAAQTTGGDPVGAAGGTQSGSTPGSAPTNQNQQQQTQPNQNQTDQQYAPKSATDQLKALLKQLSGKSPGPTGPVPQAGQNAPFALPTLARGQTGAQSPPWFYNTPMSTIAPPPAPVPSVTGGSEMPGGEQGGPDTGEPPGGEVSGSTPANARIAPNAATQPSAAVTPPAAPPGAAPAVGGGRQITVQPKAHMPWPQNEPGEVAPGGPALPTRKPTQPPQAQPQPAAAEPAETQEGPPPAAPRLLQDISGASLGSPTALADLAQAARIIAPMLPMLAGLFGGGGGRGRRGGFHGGRFTHGVGGFHPGAHGHPAWRGAWPYHHPVHGWDMHHQHPGGGWLPLNPAEMGAMGGQQGGQDPNAPNQGGPDPDRPPKETGAPVGTPDSVGTSGAIPGASAKDVDAYTRQVAQGYGIDPDVASKVLAQESSYGQARHPGDKGTSFGPFQLHFAPDGNAMGDQFRRDTGLDPRDPRTWKQQIDYAMMKASQEGWTPWTTTMKKLGMNPWSGITTNPRYAGKTSNKPLARETRVTPDMLAKLPPSSQPMVAGP